MSLITQLNTVFTRVATEFKSVRATVGTLANLTTTAKGDLVSAVNEVNAALSGAGATINDTAPSTTQVYSSQKTSDAIAAAISNLVDGADASMDTLKELADAIASDESGAAELTAALALRLRFDAVQTLTSPQQAQGIANLGAIAAADVGDVATDFVATFNAGLV